ncbi:MAG: electron transfer flavoprotein subunit beta/FixA family protein [Candidatus Eisenbacteria bacterium]|nr:electron transfer flavoprotein subunit beta/FixA family protein [Candidatus Eisenbacteria bacterium]
MKIVVCLKQVPDSETRVKVGADGRHVDLSGVSLVVNPYDEFAIEAALKLKEAGTAEDVTVLCLGPAGAVTSMRTALAMGVDRGVLLKADTGDADGRAVAVALAAKLKELAPDLVLFGKQAIDDDGSQVGPRVADLLGLPCVTVVTGLEVSGGRVRAEREIEGGLEVCECALPAVITTQKGLNEPRYPSLKGIMAAKKKEIQESDVVLEAPGLVVKAVTPPPARKPGRMVGEGAAAAAELVRVLREEARVI